ncbi:MAG: class D sortase [Chloroflexi bacterium]|nr:class D sortase [Chloroflexota bacterium]
MVKKRNPEDLSVEELRWLLINKRRMARQERLEHYRRTGRALVLAPDLENTLDTLRSGALPDDEEAAAPAPRSTRRRILDGFLLLIEVSAVAGFLFVLFNGLQLIRDLNREVASALALPTLTPTPLFVAAVLPSGHTPPDADGRTRPNEAEIPEHLRPLAQSLAAAPVPTPGPEHAIRIQVPAIRVDAPIVQGDGWEALRMGVGQHVGSANPGKKGNVVLSAHNDIYGEIFRDLDRLKSGDKIILYTNQRSYTYIVVDSQVVEPTHVEVMAPTNEPAVTLISCYPYLVDDQRIVISARLQSGG